MTSRPVRGAWIETVTENRSRPLRSLSRHPVRVQARDTLPSIRPAENHHCCAEVPACQATILYRLFRSRPFFPPRNVEITAILVTGQGCTLSRLTTWIELIRRLAGQRVSGCDQATHPLLTSLPVQQESRPLLVHSGLFFHRIESPQQRSVPVLIGNHQGVLAALIECSDETPAVALIVVPHQRLCNDVYQTTSLPFVDFFIPGYNSGCGRRVGRVWALPVDDWPIRVIGLHRVCLSSRRPQLNQSRHTAPYISRLAGFPVVHSRQYEWRW